MGDNKSKKIGAVILAAGSSSRMGKIKQLLPWKGSTLVQHVISQIKSSGIDDLIIVLGANSEVIESTIRDDNVAVTINTKWGKGMGSSIAHGTRFLLERNEDLQGILIALVDQPLIEKKHYKNLINSFLTSNSKIVSSYYSGQFGVPIILDKTFFNKLMQLGGDRGAKEFLSDYQSEMRTIDSESIGVDLDTYKKYLDYYEQYGIN